MSPAPTTPIPIYVGGLSDAALRRAARLGDGWIGTGQHPDEVPGLLEKLWTLRREAGRQAEPFETIVPLVVAPDLDVLRHLESEHGMSASTCYPFTYTLGPSSSLEAKRAAMLQFGEAVIQRLR
jgi:alkanesulfonate monooxygenase SsuD/methylene tetrahydromethanopterin reductase-like flavin-dependent oxidoreductase (luciferase family)